MGLLSMFKWLGQTSLGTLIRDSTWGFAMVEMIHLIALAILGGAVLLIDLRLLGFGLRRQSVTTVARELTPWFNGALVAMALSGIALLAGEPLKCFYHPAFRWKMALLLAALTHRYAFHRRLAQNESELATVAAPRVTAAISLALWLGVGLAGRAVGLL